MQIRSKLLSLTGLTILLLAVPAIWRDPFILGIFITTYFNIFLGVSLYPILKLGALSIGHAAFMALGAYGSALLVLRLGLPFWLTMWLGGLIAAAFAVAVGFPSLKVRGLFFCVITFGLNEIMRLTIVQWPSFLGGSSGLIGISPPDSIAIPGLPVVEFTSRIPYYYLMIILLALVLFVMHRVDRSQLGRISKAIAEEESLAESLGINVMSHKVLIFAIGCFFAGVGGAFFAHYQRILVPMDFGIWTSIYVLIYSQIGGLGSVMGPVAGAVLLTLLPEFFRFTLQYQPLVFGAIFLITILFLPEGIISLRFRFPVRLKMFFTGLRGKLRGEKQQNRQHQESKNDGASLAASKELR